MYIIREDMAILRSSEVRTMQEEYFNKFHELFIPFNYAGFPGTKDKISGIQYKETLEQALKDDKPYHIVSHRYDDFDH